ncbi:MAG: SOS response-associated peptidase family protein [Tissierellia bacterium]|nr:SOS response-associated peptidase family protein [Tissierellia bacterium]
MCGSFRLDYDVIALMKRYRIEHKADLSDKSFNGDYFPGMRAPIIRQNENYRMLSVLDWNFPLYDTGKNIFNARQETVNTKSFFANSFKLRRGILPVSSFYEWSKQPSHKFEIFDGELISIGIIFNRFKDKDNKTFEGFSILTTDSYGVPKYIHNRLPVIIPKDCEDLWLNMDTDIKELKQIMEIENKKLKTRQIGD